MIRLISSNKQRVKKIAFSLMSIMILEIISPLTAIALTSGPSQPEVQSFEPIGTSQMVDPFTGDFVYNIPLVDVGGYPVNISYHSGITMDQEASWVGLGWNINVGSLNRNLRGLPDDFDGEEIKYEKKIKPVRNFLLSKTFNEPDIEYLGKSKNKNFDILKNASIGFTLNNYKGIGYMIKRDFKINDNIGLSAGIGNQNGLNINPYVSIKEEGPDKKNMYVHENKSTSVGFNYSSRTGISSLTINRSYNLSVEDAATCNETKYGGNSVQHISTINSTYYPNAESNMNNFNVNLEMKFGNEMGFITFVGGPWNINYSQQTLKETELNIKSYGFQYAQNIEDQPSYNSIMDVNRENDGSFNKWSNFLNLANHTYDPLIASGQGVSGVFRPYRNTVGNARDRHTFSTVGKELGLGAEFSTGALAKLGTNIKLGYGEEHSKMWKNEYTENFSFKSDKFNDEPFYYKNSSDISVIDEDFYNSVGKNNPVEIDISISKANNWKPKENVGKVQREKRNEVLQILTSKEADKVGLKTKIQNFEYDVQYPSPNDIYSKTFTPKLDNGNKFTKSETSRTTYAKDGQMSEITITQGDGSRYVYSIPALNKKHIETTFSIGDKTAPSIDASTGLISYGNNDIKANGENTNQKGLDHYVDRKEIPSYAHAFMLSAVLSADYVDITGNGPSSDDLGTYVNFNYAKANANYKWRTPMSEANNKATLNRGLQSIHLDDKASYIYGEKDVWYLHSIETKSHYAVFNLSDRLDGLGANTEVGGLDKYNLLKKLDNIQLFNRNEFDMFGYEATPVKTVRFAYSYDLCPKVPNHVFHNILSTQYNVLGHSNGTIMHPLYAYNSTEYNRAISANNGKLTLHKITFTYGKSNKGLLSPYIFEYKNSNPDYAYRDSDRWGNYKPHNPLLPNEEFPFTTQDKSLADAYASAWHLSDIRLPSGGKMTVVYEADDYAYVQNEKAMQMIQVEGLSDDNQGFNNYNKRKLYQDGEEHNFIYFKMAPNSTIDDYVKGLDQLYFRFNINLASSLEITKEKYEYVSGFVNLKNNNSYGTHIQDNIKYGYVEIKAADNVLGLGEVNHIARLSWEYTRKYLPWIAFPGSDYKQLDVPDLAKAGNVLFAFIPDLIKTFVGFNTAMRLEGKSKVVDLSKSFLRLNHPIRYKYGGGQRVNKIILSDNWAGMSAENSQSFGQSYSYTTIDEETNKLISSGVASYEPLIGGEENPHRKAKLVREKGFLQPGNDFFNILPIGESMYPSPSVGYSKVTVRDLKPSDFGLAESIDAHHTGKIEHQFYTSKDFPVINKYTDLTRSIKNLSSITDLIGYGFDHAKASQGFCIELNDMNGKPKSQTIFDAFDKVISNIDYIYNVEDETAKVKTLSNTVKGLYKNGTVKDITIGIETEVLPDPKLHSSISGNLRLSPNLDAASAMALIPTFFMNAGVHSTRVETVSVTKSIHRHGLLKKVIATQDGSTIITENLAYDPETGEVLLTSVQNEFNNNSYSLNIPAYWGYDRMSGAYQNINAIKDKVVITVAGEATITDGNPFVKGDELMVTTSSSKQILNDKYWVLDIDNSNNQCKIYLVDRLGSKLPTGTYNFKIVRSGNKNLLSASLGSMVFTKNPIQEINGVEKFDTYNYSGAGPNYANVLSAGALEYKEERKQYPHNPEAILNYMCDNSNNSDYTMTNANFGYEPGKIVNPYVAGFLGNWYPYRSFVFNDKINNVRRVDPEVANQDNFNKTRIDKDGTYEKFEFWWKSSNNDNWTKGSDNNNDINNKWTWTELTTTIDANGNGLENKDAINVYNTALYGYNRMLPISVTNNAKYNQMVFDGFEDYHDCGELIKCVNNSMTPKFNILQYFDEPRHWQIWTNFTEPKAYVNGLESHTGKFSLEVKAGPIVVDMISQLQSAGANTTPLKEYKVQKEDLVPWLMPDAGDYLFYYWYKTTGQPVLAQLSYDCNPLGPNCSGSSTGNNIPLTIVDQPVTIEGWTRVCYKFTVPSGVEINKVKLKFDNSPNLIEGINYVSVFIDDIRILPLKSNMKSFVYDETNHRLMATLDENNYATFFEYDAEGNLIRTKRETTKGIMTIQENRSNKVKTNF